MDVKRVFDSEQARLTRLINSDEQIWVEKATQKTFIDVNEQGIEATAANRKLFVWFLLNVTTGKHTSF